MLTRACAEYVNEMAATPGAVPISNFTAFMRAAEANIDFGYLCHYLSDGGFFYLDYKQNVNADEGQKLDLLWREFVWTARDVVAHKVQLSDEAEADDSHEEGEEALEDPSAELLQQQEEHGAG